MEVFHLHILKFYSRIAIIIKSRIPCESVSESVVFLGSREVFGTFPGSGSSWGVLGEKCHLSSPSCHSIYRYDLGCKIFLRHHNASYIEASSSHSDSQGRIEWTHLLRVIKGRDGSGWMREGHLRLTRHEGVDSLLFSPHRCFHVGGRHLEQA